MNKKQKAPSVKRKEKKKKMREKNEEAHQITFLPVRLGTEKETMKKNGTKHTLQILKKCWNTI